MNGTQDEIVDLKAVLLALWRGKHFIAIAILVAWAAAAAKVLSSPRRHTSYSQFLFKSAEGPNHLASLASLAGLQGIGNKRSDIGQYYEAVLFSDEFLTKLVNRKYGTHSDSISLDSLWELKPAPLPDNPEYRSTKRRIEKLKIGRYIVATRNKSTGVITLKASFEDPLVARQVNSQVLQSLDEHLRLHNKSQARENRRFIEERLEEIRGDLRRSEEALLAFNLANMHPSTPRLLMEFKRLTRETTLNQELFLEMKKQLELAKIEEMKDNPLLDVISNASLPLRPEGRGLVKSLILATGLGLLLGVFVALSLHWFGAHFRPRTR